MEPSNLRHRIDLDLARMLILGGLHPSFRPAVKGEPPRGKGKRSVNNPAQLPNAKNPIRTSLANAVTDLQFLALIAAWHFAIPLLLLGAGLLLVQPCAATPFHWVYTGSFNIAASSALNAVEAAAVKGGAPADAAHSLAQAATKTITERFEINLRPARVADLASLSHFRATALLSVIP